jgi:hypothetical protein
MTSAERADPLVRLLERTYAAFNARDVEAVLAAMHPDVDWPNGMEGGRVLGHAAVRAYWIRQWGLIDPRVDREDSPSSRTGASRWPCIRWCATWPARSSRRTWSGTSTPSGMV